MHKIPDSAVATACCYPPLTPPDKRLVIATYTAPAVVESRASITLVSVTLSPVKAVIQEQKYDEQQQHA